MILYHGSNDPNLDSLETEICFTDDREIAAKYGKYVYACEIRIYDFQIMNLEENTEIGGWYPPETLDAYELADQGYDGVKFDFDQAPNDWQAHTTYWIVSEKMVGEIEKTWQKI